MQIRNSKILLLLLTIFGALFVFNIAFAQSLTNPIGTDDPREVIGNVIRALLGIVGSLALAVFIYGGFTWVISAGNEDKIKKGKDMIIWATFGLVIIFASYALVTFIITAVVDDGSSGNIPLGETEPTVGGS